MKKIIAFGHRRQVGKDTACDLLKLQLIQADHKAVVKKVSFADPLYRVCQELFGWDGFESRDYYNRFPAGKEIVLPTIGKSPRDILITLGTPCIREQIYNDTWIKLAINTKCDIMLVSDMRFPNEAEELKSIGATLIRIDRDVPKSDDVADTALLDFDGWDHVIENNGTKREFSKKLMEIANGVI